MKLKNPPKKKSPKPLGLYIHIPFCKTKCAYCDFYSLPAAKPRMDRYVSALASHLAEMAKYTTTHTVDTVYFGGGTPSYLGVKRMKLLLETVRKHYNVSPEAEITMEANPDSLGDWRAVRALRRAGVNRISLGVQSADNGELQAVGRPHTFAQAEEAVAAVRKGKIRNLSLDLIYGLPGQTMESWQRTVERAAALGPEHLSCYGLKIEEGTPLWERRNDPDIPGDDAQADMYLWAVERLEQLGYRQYEISNFAMPGFESRHNLKYWTLQEYAGLGPGAHSDLGEVRYAYVRDLDAYMRGVEKGESVVSESERIPPRDRDLEYLMLGLRTARGIEKTVFEYRFRMPFAPIQAVLERFRDTGHAVEPEPGRWRLTPTGFLISNQIIGMVLDELGKEKIRREQAAVDHDYRVSREDRGE